MAAAGGPKAGWRVIGREAQTEGSDPRPRSERHAAHGNGEQPDRGKAP